jgi:hypothetical protein
VLRCSWSRFRLSEMNKRCWGSYRFEPNSVGSFLIGPLTLKVERKSHEWRLFWKQGLDPTVNQLEVNVPSNDIFPKDAQPDEHLERFSLNESKETLSITPQLADRSVIVRPNTPFFILPGEEVTVFLSTPTWLKLEVGHQKKLLREIPIYRPSDTWFGASTLKGELCYSTKIFAQLDLGKLQKLHYRATTAVVIRNRAADPILLERLRIPVSNLCLYEATDGSLWTQTINLDRQESIEAAQMKIGESPHPHAGATQLLTSARKPLKGLFNLRVFNSLISSDWEVR